MPALAAFGAAAAGDDAAAATAAPGAYEVAAGEVTLYAGRALTTLEVTSRGDRPIQVGSHYPFSETNAALDFDRAAARGKHLAIPAGTAVRFEPGETRQVSLVANAEDATASGGEVSP